MWRAAATLLPGFLGGERAAVQRVNQRQGFLVSAVIHLTLLMILVSADPNALDPREAETAQLEATERVFLPPPSVLRQLAPVPPPPPAAARPRPAPTPPPASDPTKKDRISIGPPVQARQEGPLILRKEDDLTKVPKGRPDADPNALPLPPRPQPTPAPQVAKKQGGPEESAGRSGLRLPRVSSVRRCPRARRARGSPRGASKTPPRGPSTTRRDAGPATPAWVFPPAPARTSPDSASTPRERTSPSGSTTSRTRSTATGSCRKPPCWAIQGTSTSSSHSREMDRCRRCGC